MNFERRKSETLAALAAPWPDKSPKGSVDTPIAPLLDVINLHPSFFTTSSCSGRISILRQPSESPKSKPFEGNINHKKIKKKAGGGGWVFISHLPADPEAVVGLLFRKSPEAPGAVEIEGAEGGTLVFRFEPLIVAVECKDVTVAQELVATAFACGFRESGITSMHKRIMVAIRCSIRLEVPLGQVSLIMVSPEYVQYLIGVANEKMEANRRRTDGLLYVLQEKIMALRGRERVHRGSTSEHHAPRAPEHEEDTPPQEEAPRRSTQRTPLHVTPALKLAEPPATRRATDIRKRQWKQPWMSWRDVPGPEREAMWEYFMRMYYCKEDDLPLLRQIWEASMQRRVTGILDQARMRHGPPVAPMIAPLGWAITLSGWGRRSGPR